MCWCNAPMHRCNGATHRCNGATYRYNVALHRCNGATYRSNGASALSIEATMSFDADMLPSIGTKESLTVAMNQTFATLHQESGATTSSDGSLER